MGIERGGGGGEGFQLRREVIGSEDELDRAAEYHNEVVSKPEVRRDEFNRAIRTLEKAGLADLMGDPKFLEAYRRLDQGWEVWEQSERERVSAQPGWEPAAGDARVWQVDPNMVAEQLPALRPTPAEIPENLSRESSVAEVREELAKHNLDGNNLTVLRSDGTYNRGWMAVGFEDGEYVVVDRDRAMQKKATREQLEAWSKQNKQV